MSQKTKAHKTKKPARPLRRAKRWGGQVLPMAGKLLAITIATAVLGLMFSALQTIGTAWVRVLVSLAILSGVLLLFYSEGLSKGLSDAGTSEACDRALAAGRPVSARDEAGCYHPLKAVCTAAAVYGLPLAMALYIAATAKAYTYTLQDLPSWLTAGYGSRADVMAPLAAYAAGTSLHVQDIVRMIVRMLELLYVNLFSDPLTMSAAIDHLSPLMLLTYPIAYLTGYLCAPAQNARQHTQHRKAKKAAVRRASRSHLAEELIGSGGEVHYGQQADDQKKKRKELV